MTLIDANFCNLFNLSVTQIERDTYQHKNLEFIQLICLP